MSNAARKLDSTRLKVVADSALKLSEAAEQSRYEALFERSSDAIATFDTDGLIDAVNGALSELTGYLPADLTGRPGKVFEPMRQLSNNSKPYSAKMLKDAGTYEGVTIQCKDGSLKSVELRVRVSGNGFTLLLMRDVGEKLKLERDLIAKHGELVKACVELEKKNAELHAMQETLVQSGKMSALGELAAGIAHELNQPLQGIRGYAQELQSVAMPALAGNKIEGEASLSLKEIISNADKMATIIGYLRTFVRKSTESYEMTSVHRAIDEALKMLSRQLASRGIAVEKDFAEGLPDVYAIPLQLEQVFINLSTNARDAIESSGRGKGKIKISTQVSGPFIEVRFSDDGAGMSEKTKSKIFNPFFTTKEVGKGMGLGMSLSYGILSKIQGSIVVESELGKGTTFIIRIPRDFRETI